MPIQFVSTPISQIKKASQKGRPRGIKIGVTKDKERKPLSLEERATKRRTTIKLSAYGNRLFEPAITKEKPIIVEFSDHFIDNCRFSKDGYFAIKYFPLERRCYLFYFINPVRVHRELNLSLACQEAIEFKSFEFEDSAEYKEAFDNKDYEYAAKLQDQSSLGQTKKQIANILRELRVAENFLKRQKKIIDQENEWKTFFTEKEKREEENKKIDDEYLKSLEVNNVSETRENSFIDEGKVIIEETTIESIPEPAEIKKSGNISFRDLFKKG